MDSGYFRKGQFRSEINVSDDLKVLNLIILSISVLLPGCASISPHENFKAHLNAAIGKRLDDIPAYRWPHEKNLVNTRVLTNGNVEKTYQYLRSCRYVFEINPITRTIVGARFEGSDNDCVINP